MTAISRPFNKDCPTAYGGCTCDCHLYPGVCHVMPCCYPTKDEPLGEVTHITGDILLNESNLGLP